MSESPTIAASNKPPCAKRRTPTAPSHQTSAMEPTNSTTQLEHQASKDDLSTTPSKSAPTNNPPALQRCASTLRFNAALQRCASTLRLTFVRADLWLVPQQTHRRPGRQAAETAGHAHTPSTPMLTRRRWSTRETHSASETSKPGASETTAPTGRHGTVPTTQPVDNSRRNVRGRSQPPQPPGPVHTNAQLTTTLSPSVSAATPRPKQPHCPLQPRHKARLIHSRRSLIHTLQSVRRALSTTRPVDDERRPFHVKRGRHNDSGSKNHQLTTHEAANRRQTATSDFRFT